MEKRPIEVTNINPCPHCGKPDWCYSIGELTVCNRDHPPADGWYQTSKTDKEGNYYYAPIKQKTKKKTRPAQKRIWEYPDRNGNPLVRVIRIDDGNGGKPKRWQEKWDGEKWVKELKGVKREDIPIYRYQKIIEAILQGKTIYVVEGETCADALWKLGIPATTNIGGSKKWRHSDTLDLIEGTQQRAEGTQQKAEDKNHLTKNSQDKDSSTEDKNHLAENSPQIDGEGEDKNHLAEEDSQHQDREAEIKNHSTKDSQHKNSSTEVKNHKCENSQNKNSSTEDKNHSTKDSQEIDREADKNHLCENSAQIDGEAEIKNHSTENSQQIEKCAKDKNYSTENSALCTVGVEQCSTPTALNIVLCPDRDVPGVIHMEIIEHQLIQANIDVKIKWLYAFPNSPLWKKIPTSSGLDVVDWIADYQLKAEDIINSVEPKRVNSVEPKTVNSVKNQSVNSDTHLGDNNSINPPQMNIEDKYTQMCIKELYSDQPWKAIEGQLYQWDGKYYKKASQSEERKRIAHWCNTTPVKNKEGWEYSYATPTHIDGIWRWLLDYVGHPTEKVNPPGWNCLNGVVKINWDKNQVSWELVPHDPGVVYTYISEVNFDPLADSTDCDKMLSCLELAQQQLFLKTIASALDLKTVRKYRGREVKALLCKGHGNNGKDTLREAIRMLFGHTLTNATVSDFAGYDGGRKFSLAKLEGASINWSSENSSFNNLDRLQSLKAAITGESLDIERKGIDEHEVMLNCVFLFNINEVPNLKAAMEAIQSRWAVLSFNKTYKKNADPNKGEIEADSRFRYDPNFLTEKVCPALLNKLLNALNSVMSSGIDYSCTSDAIKNIQEETNHLWAFAREVGLDYLNGGRVYINDLWELLYKWYINNGTLEIISENGKEKKVWHEQVKQSDKNVKAPNQIYQRFSELFPKIKKERDTSHRDPRTGQFYLSGISIKVALANAEANAEAIEANAEANAEAENLIQSHAEAAEAIYPTLVDILNKTHKLSREQKSELASILLGDKELADLIQQKIQVENSKIDNLNDENLTEGDEIASASSAPHSEGVTASATASAEELTASAEELTASAEELTASVEESTAEPSQFTIEDRVTTSDSSQHKGIGTIISIRGDTLNVLWDETGEIQSYQPLQLRTMNH